MTIRIGLVYDLRKDYLAEGFSPEEVSEFDSEDTVNNLEEAIKSLGYQVERIGHAKALCAALVVGKRWDLVFNVAEGVKGRSREAQVPAILEVYDVPYTFSDPLVSAVTLDKAVSKRLIKEAGLYTPDYKVVERLSDLDGLTLRYPLFAKPIAEGTGKGIEQDSRIDNQAQLLKVCSRILARCCQPVLVEEYLAGREFTVGIVGTASKSRVIGTMEVEILEQVGGTVYSLETKERCEELVRYTELREAGLRKIVEKLALDCYLALECRDGGRVDVKLDAAGKPAFMEVNTLPGLHPTHSDLPMIATNAGMGYAELLGAIIDSAKTRMRAKS